MKHTGIPMRRPQKSVCVRWENRSLKSPTKHTRDTHGVRDPCRTAIGGRDIPDGAANSYAGHEGGRTASVRTGKYVDTALAASKARMSLSLSKSRI